MRSFVWLLAPVLALPLSAATRQDAGTPSDADRQRILLQRQEELAARYIAVGDDLLARGDLNGALQQFAEALQIRPADTTARERLRQVEALMGQSYAGAAEFAETSAQRELIRRAQARMAAEEASVAGDAALRRGDYAEALTRYREADLILSYHPLIASGDLDREIMGNKVASAQALQAEALREDARQRERAAEEARLAAEQDQREYREKRLHQLYSDAYQHFRRENYAKAEQFARQILQEDPGNPDALELADIAARARHTQTDDHNRRALHEQWIRTFEELATMAVPQIDSIQFDERWSEVALREPITFGERDPQASAEKEAIKERLSTTRFAPRFGEEGEGEPLAEVAAFLQQLTGVNFLVSSRVRDELDEQETAVSLELPETSVLKVLNLISDTSESVRWKIEDGVVKFVHIEEMVGGQELRMYEVRDLIHPVPDFPGPELNIAPSGGLEPLDEDLEEREALVVTSDALEALIRDNVAPESWDADPRNNLRITESGTMVVFQMPEVHDQIGALLDDLREATGIMVDIESRFLNVEDNFLEDIGVDFRGLGAPGPGTNDFLNDFGSPSVQPDLGSEIGQDTSLGAFYENGDADIKARVENLYGKDLGNGVLSGSGGLSFQWTYLNDLQVEMILRAVSKSERIELVTAPRLLVFNTARANLMVLNQTAYVQDYDVEIAQAASIADPIVQVARDGVILDVRPVVSADRRFITLEIRPTVAELKRPIQEVTTSLGTQSSVTIQLPELEIARVRTSVPMPDGGTVLLGGLKIHEQQELQSGIPILNKIPVLSLLFERKGNFVSNRKLLILLKAKIVIPAEHEPGAAAPGGRVAITAPR